MGVTPITIPQSLAYVLNNAGEKSGVDFDYLVKTAERESAMNPSAKAPSSSAVGLFQFLDQSWLAVMKTEGPRLGYQQYSDAISVAKDGTYTIKDKALLAKVLKLREDPQVAADMAAAFTRSNGIYLQAKFGRMPSPGELYIAHFLGAQGAEKMFNAGLQDPDQVAAKLFPTQAKANPAIFYGQDGHARTVREVYKALVSQHDGIVAEAVPDVPDSKFAAQQMAAPTPATSPAAADDKGWSTDAVPSRFTKADMSFTALFATEAPSGVATPLIGAEAEAPLLAAKGGQPLIDGLSGPTADPANGQPLALMSPTPTPTPDSLAAISAATSPSGARIGDPFAAPSPLLAPDGRPLITPDKAPAAFAGTGTDDGQSSAGAPFDLTLDSSNPLADQTGQPAASPDMGIPQPRVLISKGVVPNPAFFTQLLAAGG